jgi:pimeloyl-ACP methyl ester carboxylesterase
MKLYFDDEAFDGQLQRSVGKADSGMANVGECLAIAERISPGDRDSWYRAWSAGAARLVRRGTDALAAGHRVSARNAFLRAAEYYRQAFFFHREDLDGPELRAAYAASVRAFRSALPLLDARAQILAGPASGYLFTPQRAEGPCPTILHIGGYDGTAEELWASAGPALARGYAFVALDGPGQGATLYEQRVPMRPDWENVVPALFEAVTADPAVDPERVVLVGRSFGGYLAPRAAAGEHRLAAMIVDPGQFDMGLTLATRLGPLIDQVHDPAADPQFDSLLELPALKALLEPRMTAHGVSRVRAYCAEMLRYTNADTVDWIRCPSFVTDNETDLISTGQGKVLYDHLACPSEFRFFTREEGAEGHCEGMAPVVFWDAAFDWLDSAVFSSSPGGVPGGVSEPARSGAGRRARETRR